MHIFCGLHVPFILTLSWLQLIPDELYCPSISWKTSDMKHVSPGFWQHSDLWPFPLVPILISYPIFSPTPLPCWQYSTHHSEPKLLLIIFNEMSHSDFKFNLDKAVELRFKSAPSVEFMFPKCTVSFMYVWMLPNASGSGENRFCDNHTWAALRMFWSCVYMCLYTSFTFKILKPTVYLVHKVILLFLCMVYSSKKSLHSFLNHRSSSTPILFASKDCFVISLSILHWGVRSVNMKINDPEPNLSRWIPPTVSKLIFADESPLETISSSNVLANLCGVHS